MTKKEHVEYWKTSSEKDWEVVESLFSSGHYVYSLYFAHLVLEKISKALWVKHNEENFPPKSHNIVYLLENSSVELNEIQKDFLLTMNDFQLEGRYPDYKQKVYEICTKKKTEELLTKVEEIKAWLTSRIS